jgi:hypothetical protein
VRKGVCPSISAARLPFYGVSLSIALSIMVRSSPKNMETMTGGASFAQVIAKKAEDISKIELYIKKLAQEFGVDLKSLLESDYYVLKPNTNNPYHQLYVYN